MIEVSIRYGNEEGDGVNTYLVDAGKLQTGFDSQLYNRAWITAFQRFVEQEPEAHIDRVTFRHVPNNVLKAV